MVLYEAAFAVVVTWFHHRRGTALLAVTVVAGFASTIFMPLTGWLAGSHGWRTALLVLAALYGALAIPLHLLIRRPPAAAAPAADRTAGRPGRRTRRRHPNSPAHATISDMLTLPMSIAKAAAPLAAATARNLTGSYTPAILATAVCCAIAATGLAAVHRLDQGRSSAGGHPSSIVD